MLMKPIDNDNEKCCVSVKYLYYYYYYCLLIVPSLLLYLWWAVLFTRGPDPWVRFQGTTITLLITVITSGLIAPEENEQVCEWPEWILAAFSHRDTYSKYSKHIQTDTSLTHTVNCLYTPPKTQLHHNSNMQVYDMKNEWIYIASGPTFCSLDFFSLGQIR